MPPQSAGGSNALSKSKMSEHSSCGFSLISPEAKENLKSAIVEAITFGRDTYADRPDFFANNHVSVGIADLRPKQRDIVVYVSGRNYCGTGGCKGFIFKNGATASDNSDYSLVGRIRPARLPIYSLKTSRNGWREVGVVVAGGGIPIPYVGALSFDGTAFDGNPTISSARPTSKGEIHSVIISEQSADSHSCRLS
ncbi:hypothetical protein [Parasphingorhabdus litoris]|uniref:hypothetical protein n=1 Tax=Parasphingorhabdus litoris TaxID=394733 RepID=UPI001E4A4064|nr:hypothetical protein [Parasphingorhabdus litoris]